MTDMQRFGDIRAAEIVADRLRRERRDAKILLNRVDRARRAAGKVSG